MNRVIVENIDDLNSSASTVTVSNQISGFATENTRDNIFTSINSTNSILTNFNNII